MYFEVNFLPSENLQTYVLFSEVFSRLKTGILAKNGLYLKEKYKMVKWKGQQ